MKKFSLSFILPAFTALSIVSTSITAQNIPHAASSEYIEEAASENSGTLSFFMRDAENGYGIKSEIQISSKGKSILVQSDESGHILFINSEGRYDVTFSAAGHLPLNTYFFIEKGNTVNAEVNMDRINRTPIRDLNLSGALVEGYIIDSDSGKPMKGVTVSMGSDDKTKSDEKGHFSVFSSEYSVINSTEDLPVRKSFTFSSPGYRSYKVNNLLLSPTKISMNITLEKGEGQKTEKYLQHVLDGTQEDVDLYEKNIPESNNNAQNKSNNSVSTASGCIVPTTIRVGTGCSCTNCSGVSVMSLQHYTETGIDNEWISSWQSNSISAGSVAYRTYGAWYVNHPVKPNFDIASTTCNQVWGANVYANCQAAALATAGMVLTSDGINPARAEFSSENNGQGAASGVSCGNCFSGTGSGYPCFSDNVCCGKARFGHGRGMCQWGTQRWSQSGQNFSWIISHYYTIGNMTVCGAPASCGTPSGLTAGSISDNSALLSWTAIPGAASYNVEYKLSSSSTWTTVASSTPSKSISGLNASSVYQFQVQAVCSVAGAYSSAVSFTTLAAVSFCGTPSGLSAGSITSGSAVLSWTAVSGAGSYNVQYKPSSSSAWTIVTATSASMSISGLSAATVYQFEVQAVCSSAGSYSSAVSFTTSAAASTSSTLTIGTAASPYSAHPFGSANSDERASYIMKKSELAASGWSSSSSYLNSIAFNVSSAATSQPLGNFTITIAHTAAASFAGTSFLAGANAVTVYSGTYTTTTGWNSFNFNTSFVYDGTSNLLITICWNNSSFSANSSVLANSYSDYMALYYRANISNGDVCSQTAGTQSYYRPNAKLTFSSSAQANTFEGGQQRSLIVPPVSNPDAVDKAKFEIFPNPFDGAVLYGRLTNTENKNLVIKVYDMMGREIASKEVLLNEESFSISFSEYNIKPGMYMITGLSGSSRYTKIIVVK